jgi:hypothetical protein
VVKRCAAAHQLHSKIGTVLVGVIAVEVTGNFNSLSFHGTRRLVQPILVKRYAIATQLSRKINSVSIGIGVIAKEVTSDFNSLGFRGACRLVRSILMKRYAVATQSFREISAVLVGVITKEVTRR